MYLYEDDWNGNILTYQLNENARLAQEYRKQELRKQYNDYLSVYKAIDCNGSLSLEFTENVKHLTKNDIINLAEKNVVFETDNDIIEATLDAYYNGKYTNKKVAFVENTDIDRAAALLITDEYKKQKSKVEQDKEEYVMHGIIALSANLFNLQMLEQGNFSIINDFNMDISEPLRVFNFQKKPIYSIEINAIKEAIISNLLDVDFNEFMNKVDESSIVLEKVKKVYQDK